MAVISLSWIPSLQVRTSSHIFHFVDTTSINLSGVYIDGSIIAPSPQSLWSGAIDGQLIGYNINLSAFTSTGNSFTGNIPASAIPEPGTYALLLGITSLGSLAFQRRRRRRKRYLRKLKLVQLPDKLLRIVVLHQSLAD